MKLYNTTRGPLATADDGTWHALGISTWDELASTADLLDRVRLSLGTPALPAPAPQEMLAPIGSQEVWAAGVTYFRSRDARMEESKSAGGGSFYDRVYSAERPELFFKATAYRVVGPEAEVRVRADATWSVPEPELTLFISPAGKILGYTIGNDMSSRDIEGENPLYLPQAKVYDGSCALGPCVLLAEQPLPRSTAIAIAIQRAGRPAFEGRTTLLELKRDPEELVHYLYRETSFPAGAYLMTGTGIVPGDDFSLEPGDRIEITIEGIGILANTVAAHIRRHSLS